MLPTTSKVVFLIDVDNTLIDNDSFGVDLSACLDQQCGESERQRYWAVFATLRDRVGYADYLGALQIFRAESNNSAALMTASAFMLDYPFRSRLYPRALSVIEHLQTLGQTVVLSDGDIVFQPRKIKRAGVWDAVGGRVLVYVHKELSLDDVERRYPAAHYVVIDDKLRLLAAMKGVLADRLTTVFVRQGHYARDIAATEIGAADVTVDQIGDLCEFAFHQFFDNTSSRPRTPTLGGKETRRKETP